MEDKRIPLKRGSVLRQGNVEYTISEMIYAGGNALIYRAEKLEYGKRNSVLLKEAYPYIGERGRYIRTENGKIISTTPEDEENLKALYRQMEEEEKAGGHIRDKSFMVCPIKNLRQIYYGDSGEKLDGLAELDLNMNGSGVLLAELMKELEDRYEGKIPVSVSLRLMKQIAATMEKIHQSGYLYCDFSPGNLFLLRDTWEAVFIDFGSARKIEKGCIKITGNLSTTWGYRAPETIIPCYYGTRILNKASDVYSVMALFYRLLSGADLAERDNEDEFYKARTACKRVLEWERMQEIEIQNPVSACFLNKLLKEGLEGYRGKRISDFEVWRRRIEELEEYLNLETNLFQALYRMQQASCMPDELVSVSMEKAKPDRMLLFEAIDKMDAELHRNHKLSDISFVFQWLLYWFLTSYRNESEESKKKETQLYYCGIAVYNHLGNFSRAILFYDKCIERKHLISLEKYLDMQLRAAVSMENICEFDRAFQLIEENLRVLEKLREKKRELALECGLDAEVSSRTVLYGKNISAAGRYCAFKGKYKKAKRFFEEALRQFEYETKERERTGNYLWNLSVAMGDRELFEEYREKYLGRKTLEKQIKELLSFPEGQNIYHLSVFLKGIYKWYAGQLSDEFKKTLEELVRKGLSGKYRMDMHPWQFIFRYAALILAAERGQFEDAVQNLFMLSLNVTERADSSTEDSFSIMKVLHMITETYQYKTMLHSGEESRQEYIEQGLTCKVNEIFEYFQKCGCSLLIPDEWHMLCSTEDRMQYLIKKINYEYA